MKVCDTCQKEIPEDYNNLLCDDCYKKLEAAVKTTAPEEIKEEVAPVPPEEKKPEVNGITNPEYKENPQMDDKEQWQANFGLFQKYQIMLWKPTRQMYTYIKDYCLDGIKAHPQYPKFIWKPKIVDVGCGTGVGSNVMSQEADFVWGIDKNLNSIKFAKECFERVKNQIYYSSQVTFDQIDIMSDTRDFARFDVVVAIEIIEHIDDYRGFLSTIIKKFSRVDKDGRYDLQNPTDFFISTPNRNNKSILDNGPKNIYHVREWTASEYYDVLSEFFKEVKFMNAIGEAIPAEENRTTTHTPLLAKCRFPNI